MYVTGISRRFCLNFQNTFFSVVSLHKISNSLLKNLFYWLHINSINFRKFRVAQSHSEVLWKINTSEWLWTPLNLLKLIKFMWSQWNSFFKGESLIFVKRYFRINLKHKLLPLVMGSNFLKERSKSKLTEKKKKKF